MVPLNSLDQLKAAWRALSGYDAMEGWRTIAISSNKNYNVRAGRKFPANEEALLVGFSGSPRLPTEALPEGRGFKIVKVDLPGESADIVWLALGRHASGNIDLFCLMALDVVQAFTESDAHDATTLLRRFLSRVRAWQDFMRRSNTGTLDTESEIGLFGELVVMREFIDGGLGAYDTVKAWTGPHDGVHDFAFGTGAAEVKTSARTSGFVARIGSIEQLDDSVIRPLHLVAVKLTQDADGQTLPERVQEIRDILAGDGTASESFENSLLRVGYSDGLASSYTRMYSIVALRLFLVNENFPRLTRASVPLHVVDVTYDLLIDHIESPDLSVRELLENCGVV
jgi:hypothetical protein